jgi:hypothetical protein
MEVNENVLCPGRASFSKLSFGSRNWTRAYSNSGADVSLVSFSPKQPSDDKQCFVAAFNIAQ